MRDWVRDFQTDLSAGFNEWDSFCQSPLGCRVETTWIEVKPELPVELENAIVRLAQWVPDESPDMGHAGQFNGPRYCLSKIERDLRWAGEEIGCKLSFSPSDYRTFLVTNGIDHIWAQRAGLADQFQNSLQWAKRWTGLRDSSGFYENSFGINVLISVVDNGRRVAVFRERGRGTAIRNNTIVGSADEGLRRAYGDRLFDQKSKDDPTPSIWSAVYRAVEEEIGITRRDAEGQQPMILSIGRTVDIWQPAALIYWPLKMTRDRLQAHLAAAQDRHYEFNRHHFVDFTEEGIRNFVLQKESTTPVESWVTAMALYSLRTSTLPSVFLSHSSRDKQFVRALGTYLKSRGIRVWIDEAELGIGDSLIMKLSEAIEHMDFVVAVISSSSVNSNWVKFELEQAMTEQVKSGDLTVLPVLKESCDVPKFLNGKVFADCRTRYSRRRAKEKLANTILYRKPK
jgi:hypothetical protein